LGKDIDLTAYLSGTDWTPIGKMVGVFSGTFDGGGHRITGLSITGSSDYLQGLFAKVYGATIQNLVLEAPVINVVTPSATVGGIVANATDSTISNCAVIGGSVINNGASSYATGGIAGEIHGGPSSIGNSYCTANVKGDSNVGGIAGSVIGGPSIYGCYYKTGNVDGVGTGDSNAGGIAGNVIDSDVYECYSTGTVTGMGNNVGGIVGAISGSSYAAVERCYASGNVITGGDFVGGIAGFVGTDGYVERCVALSIAVVSGTLNVGRVAGTDPGTLNFNYANNAMVGGTFLSSVTGKDGADVVPSTLDDTWWTASPGWTFGTYDPWKDDGSSPLYPILYWEDRPALNTPSLPDATVGSPYTTVIVTSTPAAFPSPVAVTDYPSSSTMPSGLAFNNSTGVFSGTPTTAGDYTVIVWADNAEGSSLGNWIFSITVNTYGSTYTVTFNTMGGSSVASMPSVPSGSKISAPSPPTLSGYDFDGWYKDSGCTTPWVFTSDSVTANTTLYAKWLPLFTVTFDPQGGSAVTPASVASGKRIYSQPANPTMSGHVFGGWYREAACTTPWNFAADVVTGNLTLYAKWLQQFTVAFDTQGGSYVPSAASPPNATISPPLTPSRAGYVFAGWYKEAACVNAWDFGADTVAADTTLYAMWTPDGGESLSSVLVESIAVSGFPLTIVPGDSFTATVSYVTASGLPPYPVPSLAVSPDGGSELLVSAEMLTDTDVLITALASGAAEGKKSQRPPDLRGAPAQSIIYGNALFGFTSTQAISADYTHMCGTSKTLVIADELPTRMDLAPAPAEEFIEANVQLVPSEVVILPGNVQPPMAQTPPDWHVLTSLESAEIYVREPDGFKLPECFVSTGKDAADIIINVSHAVPAGKKGLVPMTYIVTVSAGDLADHVGAYLTDEILANPYDCLDEIFDNYVLQKEILQGERAGWYTRLVDGVLTPRKAVELGILDLTGGDALTMTLSYYALDDAILEAYESGGYLIIPDGKDDGAIVDPVWLNNWGEGYWPGKTYTGSGGGGCNRGAGAISLITAVTFLALNRRREPR
jgi:uncharacterized repeat protein (TIGR02543 family)